MLHPKARVKLLFWFRVIRLPAWFYLLFWVAFQVLAVSAISHHAGPRIAYGAHVGGFAAGMFLSIFDLPRMNPKDF